MMETKRITGNALNELLKKLHGEGRRIIAPVVKNEKVVFDEVRSIDLITHEYIQTIKSAKVSVFPRYEEILHYENTENGVIIHDERVKDAPTVVFGTRPCDAGSFAVLDAVFNGDYDDMFYLARRKSTAVISVSCEKADEYCFCTSMGGGPGDTAGSDMLLSPIGEDVYFAEILTEKGKNIAASAPGLFTAAVGDEENTKQASLAKLEPQFDLESLLKKVEVSFDDGIYMEQSLRCLGCGACSYVCPTCTCFDIQDEYEGAKGIRLRCWDSCGFGHFTLHTSWHNPRHVQSKRWRQRIMHKFFYQPDTLHTVGCTGCGRCSRSCPADMNLLHHLKSINAKTFAEKTNV